MCKYCEEEFIYHDDDGELFILTDCKECGLNTFVKIEDEHCDDLESYSITKYYTACEMEYGLTTICNCDSDGEYLLVNVKDTSVPFDIDYKSWLSIYDMEDVNFNECPQCGNEENLYYEVDLGEDPVCLSIICPKCHCIDKHEL